MTTAAPCLIFFFSNMINKFKSEHSKQLGLSVGHGSTLTRTCRSGVFSTEAKVSIGGKNTGNAFHPYLLGSDRRLKDRIRDYRSSVHFYGSSLQPDR